MAEKQEHSYSKVTVKNRARAPRGFVVKGKHVLIEPGQEGEVELDEYTIEKLKESSEKGGDLEVMSSSQPRAKMKER